MPYSLTSTLSSSTVPHLIQTFLGGRSPYTSLPTGVTWTTSPGS